jgi:hypothetical protein
MTSSSRIYASPLTLSQNDANVTGLINGTYTLSITASPPVGVARNYAAVVYSGSPSTVTVSGAQASPQALTFDREYQVALTESGLPSGTQWTVTFNSVIASSSSPTINYDELNGTFTYSVGAVNGYLPNPSSGSATVSGKNLTVGIIFSQSGVTYPVKFVETGLPASTAWSVMLGPFLGTSTTTSATFNVVNGTYAWDDVNSTGNAHYYSSTPSGSVTVSGNTNLPKWMGNTLQVNVTFHYGYTVTFVPKNLTKYVQWSIMYNGTSNSSKTGGNITFMIRNGSDYLFTVSFAQANWASSPAKGYLNISGAAETFKLNMTKLYFPVIFRSDLPAGVLFSVIVNGTTYTSANGTVYLHVHNGTMQYSFGAVAGYTVSPASGTITESFAPITINVAYSTTGSGSGGSSPIVLTELDWGIIAGVVAVILIIAGLAIHGTSKHLDRIESRVNRIGKKKKRTNK